MGVICTVEDHNKALTCAVLNCLWPLCGVGLVLATVWGNQPKPSGGAIFLGVLEFFLQFSGVGWLIAVLTGYLIWRKHLKYVLAHHIEDGLRLAEDAAPPPNQASPDSAGADNAA